VTLTRRTVAQMSLAAVGFGLARAGIAAEASAPSLFSAFDLRGLALRNRMVMAPMTRGRAGPTRTANALMAEYYAQRASAGLIVTEGVAISPQGYGWRNSPGIYSDAHVKGWQGVTKAVHEQGGHIFLQLWHTGRVSHPSFQDGALPVGPSAIAAKGETRTPGGEKASYVTPRALSEKDIAQVVRDFARATELSREAGFDGVEIHGANGYLVDQFIRDGSNLRTDAYGGSVANRLRFLGEVTAAVVRAWSADRVGVRLSPHNPYNGMRDSQPQVTFVEAARSLDGFGLAYLHVLENINEVPAEARVVGEMRKVFKAPLILNDGYDAQSGAAALAAGRADLIAYGRPFIANPDLVARFKKGAKLAKPDFDYAYTEGARGYTDYPPA
jgi:N-ethylmaleimide reductase